MTPSWRPGDPIWYSPTLGGARYPGVVDSEPRLLGGVTWVVRLRDMAPEYGLATGRPGRTTVAAAECQLHVTRRRRPLNPEYVADVLREWDEPVGPFAFPPAGMVPEEISGQAPSSASETNSGAGPDVFDLAAAYARVLSRRAVA